MTHQQNEPGAGCWYATVITGGLLLAAGAVLVWLLIQGAL